MIARPVTNTPAATVSPTASGISQSIQHSFRRRASGALIRCGEADGTVTCRSRDVGANSYAVAGSLPFGECGRRTPEMPPAGLLRFGESRGIHNPSMACKPAHLFRGAA